MSTTTASFAAIASAVPPQAQNATPSTTTPTVVDSASTPARKKSAQTPRPTSNLASQPKSPTPFTNSMTERLHFFFLSLLGQVVVVHVAPHAHAYEGIFYSFRIHSDANDKASPFYSQMQNQIASDSSQIQPQAPYYSIVLRLVRRRVLHAKAKNYDDEQKLIEVFCIASKDIQQIIAKDVMFATEHKHSSLRNDPFRTDTQISNGASLNDDERVLVKWEGDERYDPKSPNFIGDLRPIASSNARNEPYDMYAANARFGVKSTYDENLYTTPLDKSDPELVRQAAIHAAEIENSKYMSDNVHVREDRGIEVDDDELDEESRYSTVLRDVKKGASPAASTLAPSTKGAYLPPHLRPAQQETDKKPAPSTNTKKDTTPAQTPSPQQPQQQSKPATTTTPSVTTAKDTSTTDSPAPPAKSQESSTNSTPTSEKKPILNPNAKAFNPNAKPFIPTPIPAMPYGGIPPGYPAAPYPGTPMQSIPPYAGMPPPHGYPYHAGPVQAHPPYMGPAPFVQPHAFLPPQPSALVGTPPPQQPNATKHINGSMQQTFHQQHSPPPPMQVAPHPQAHRGGIPPMTGQAPSSMSMPHDKKTSIRGTDTKPPRQQKQ